MSDSRFPFGGMQPPAPPRELRDRALRAARAAALTPERETAARWRFSRFDLAWLGALVVLLACHLGLSLQGRRSHTMARSHQNGDVEQVADRGAAREAGIPDSVRLDHQHKANAEQPLSFQRLLRAGS